MPYRHPRAKIDQSGAGTDADVDLGIGTLETAEPRHQPLHGEGGRGRDGEMTAAIFLQQLLGRLVQLVEGAAHRGQVGLACFRQQERTIATHEQF
jgi:hypothetical protein